MENLVHARLALYMGMATQSILSCFINSWLLRLDEWAPRPWLSSILCKCQRWMGFE